MTAGEDGTLSLHKVTGRDEARRAATGVAARDHVHSCALYAIQPHMAVPLSVAFNMFPSLACDLLSFCISLVSTPTEYLP